MAIEIIVPRLGWTMDEGTFVQWLKNEGDWVQPGDMLFSIEGDKATQEIESFDGGILRRDANGPNPGDVVKVGQRLGLLLARGEVVAPPEPVGPAIDDSVASPLSALPASSASPASSALPAGFAGPAARRLARRMGVELSRVRGSGPRGRIQLADLEDHTRPAPSTPADPMQGPVIKATPRARRVARTIGVDWRSLTGSGRGGRVRERDVLDWLADQEHRDRPQRMADSCDRIVTLTPMRRRIAARLSDAARAMVPVTLTTTADASSLVAARGDRDSSSTRVTYNDLFLYVVGKLLRHHSELTAQWRDEGLYYPAAIHIGLAIDLPGGLVAPVIRDVDQLTLPHLAQRTAELIAQARAGKLTAADMQGGTFTVTNLGAWGIDAFTPVIQPPQSAILGIGAIHWEPAVVGDRIEPRHRVSLSLTFDHRVLDGAAAARFLQALRSSVEQERIADG